MGFRKIRIIFRNFSAYEDIIISAGPIGQHQGWFSVIGCDGSQLYIPSERIISAEVSDFYDKKEDAESAQLEFFVGRN